MCSAVMVARSSGRRACRMYCVDGTYEERSGCASSRANWVSSRLNSSRRRAGIRGVNFWTSQSFHGGIFVGGGWNFVTDRAFT